MSLMIGHAFFSVAIKPLVDVHTVHHLMIVGCPEPANNAFANDGKYWYVDSRIV